jgi:glycine betaine/proline transport system ATP-binding protein
VANDNQKLIGVIVRGSILGALAIEEDYQDDLT